MDDYNKMNNSDDAIDYSDWGWYIDTESIETNTCHRSKLPHRIKLKRNYVIDIIDLPYKIYGSNEVNETERGIYNNIKNYLFKETGMLQFYKKPSTELFVRVGSTTLISSIMAYVIFFVL